VKPLPRWLRWSASALVLALAAVLLVRQLRGLDPAQLRAAWSTISPAALVACLAATALSFGCLAAYERLATQWFAPGVIPRAVAWRTGLVAHALANTLGFHPLTAVALRLERYRACGVDAFALAKIVAAIGACVAGGALALLAAAGAWWLWRWSPVAGLAAIAAVAAGGALLHAARPRGLPQAGRVFALGLLEAAAATVAFVVLVPAGALPEGPALVLLFVGASVLGVVSHAPGGLGVFEATILAAAAPGTRAAVLAGLLAYRLLYNLLPCALALLALAAGALRRGRLSSTAGTRA
jgi:uncharacterized membrane protein YbhN (UPF0104 family)